MDEISENARTKPVVLVKTSVGATMIGGCTGTFISPHAVLTGGHCVPVNRPTVQVSISIQNQDYPVNKIFTEYTADCEKQSPRASKECNAIDYAILSVDELIANKAGISKFYTIAESKIVEKFAPTQTKPLWVYIIGFGQNEEGSGSGGIKREGITSIIYSNGKSIQQYCSDPRTCALIGPGDSGGPVVLCNPSRIGARPSPDDCNSLQLVAVNTNVSDFGGFSHYADSQVVGRLRELEAAYFSAQGSASGNATASSATPFGALLPVLKDYQTVDIAQVNQVKAKIKEVTGLVNLTKPINLRVVNNGSGGYAVEVEYVYKNGAGGRTYGLGALNIYGDGNFGDVNMNPSVVNYVQNLP